MIGMHLKNECASLQIEIAFIKHTLKSICFGNMNAKLQAFTLYTLQLVSGGKCLKSKDRFWVTLCLKPNMYRYVCLNVAVIYKDRIFKEKNAFETIQ